MVYDLSSPEATRPSGLEAAGNAPLRARRIFRAPAEELPRPESPPVDQISAASPPAVRDGDIRTDKQGRADFLGAAYWRPKRYPIAIITGSVLLGLGLGWLSRSTHLSAAVPPNKPVPSHCAVDSDQETICAVRTSDHLDSPASTSSSSQDVKAVPLPTKQAALSPAPTTVSLPAKQTTHSPAPTAVDRAKFSARPIAVPETRPATIKGWKVRNVIGGTAVLEGPNGIRNVRRGDNVSGLGKIEDILRWGRWWIVATERGLISTQ